MPRPIQIDAEKTARELAKEFTARKGGKLTNPDFNAPYEATDTLQSYQMARVVYVISEGRIRGFANGMRSLLLDGVPVQNADGSYNKKGINVIFKDGSANQEAPPDFFRTRAEVAVGEDVLANVAADNVLTATGNPSDGDTVTIGAEVWTFKNTLAAANQVKIGTTTSATLDNFVAAVNHDTGEGTAYGTGTVASELVSAERGAGDAVRVEALEPGEEGNAIATTETSAVLSWDTATLAGGVNNAVTVRVTDTNIDQVNVRIRIPSLTTLNTETQEYLGGEVQYRIQVSTNEAGYVDQNIGPDGEPYDIVSGKCTSPYERQYQIVLPAGGPPWDIRVKRDTPDSDSSAVNNKTVFAGLTKVSYTKMAYSDTAYIAATLNTRDFGTHIPDVTGDFYGIYLLVPTNYDPETGIYATSGEGTTGGIWDGTFKEAWSDNPIWAWYTLVLNNRFGLGNYVDAQYMDPPGLYELAQYCDERIPDGVTKFVVQYIQTAGTPGDYDLNIVAPGHTFAVGDWVWLKNAENDAVNGLHQVAAVTETIVTIAAHLATELVDANPELRLCGTERRYRLNALLNTPETAANTLQALAANFRGIMYAGAGGVALTMDKPRDIDLLVSPSNIEGGRPNYTSTDLFTRHNTAIVWYSDPDDQSRMVPEIVEDGEAIERAGMIREISLIAPGVASRGHAYRLAKLYLETDLYETQIADYVGGLEHEAVRPGSILSVADPRIMGFRGGGKVKSSSPNGAPTTIVLDSEVDLTSPDEVYSLRVRLPDGTNESRAITNVGVVTATIEVESAYSDSPLKGAQWQLAYTAVNPRLFRCMDLTENGDAKFNVTAVEHDPTKYDRIELDIDLPQPPISDFPTGALGKPSNINYIEEIYRGATGLHDRATFSWTAPRDARAVFFECEIKRPTSGNFEPIGTRRGVSIDVEIFTEGEYTFRVRALDAGGSLRSDWESRTVVLRGFAINPGNVDNFVVNVQSDTAHFQWDVVADLVVDHYEIRYSPELVADDADWAGAQVLAAVIYDNTKALPAIVGSYMIKAISFNGRESVSATVCVLETPSSLELNQAAAITEHTAFAGDLESVQIVSRDGIPGIELAASGEDTLATWTYLAAVKSLALGAGGYAESGIYNFANGIDIGVPATLRLTSQIKSTGINMDNTLSSWATLASVANLAGVVQGEVGVELQLRFTSDDPGDPGAVWSEWQNFVVGDYLARAFQFRLILWTVRERVTPRVYEAGILAQIPTRNVRGNDIPCGAGGIRVNFVPPFISDPPTVLTNDQDLATGDYKRVTNVDATGFDIRFYDSGGSGVARTFDYHAIGWGYDFS